MSMSVSAVRFEPEDKEWIEAFAAMNGISFSAQVRSWTLERLEDELDAHDLKLAIRESEVDSSDVGIDINELAAKLGID